MTSQELRQSFLDFFAGHDHHIMASAPLKPTDETTLFTIAGMQPFVPWFRGLVPPAAPRVASCQKCFRADDVEQVGQTPWHSTFFEMLGNFSFGDYFKREAIEYAWEYLTRVLQLPTDRLWITVHPDDEEAPLIWRDAIGVPAERIAYDPGNFWALGATGPCGPCTEMHLDGGEEAGCGRPDCSPVCECNRFTELWNLVFQMYNRTEAGVLEPLSKPGIDTGMGMERLTLLLQGVSSIFETDLLAPIVAAVVEHARAADGGLPEPLDEGRQRATWIIAEHLRSLVFLLADGFTPSNEGAGYVVRRVLRRACRFGRRLGFGQPFLHALVPVVVATTAGVYDELAGAQKRVTTWLEQEEKQFAETLDRSSGPLMAAIERAKAAGLSVLPGEDVFRLHDTYGLPRELAADFAAEEGLSLDDEGFERAMAEQRERARARAEEDFASTVRVGYRDVANKTSFVGYELCEGEGRVIGIVKGGAPVDTLAAGSEGEVFLDRTPFYAEVGGQVGDTGAMVSTVARAEVFDTTFPVEGAHAHHVRVIEGDLKVGQTVTARVDEERRQAIARAHTATHLLHHVLRNVLGEHAVQSGSLVEPDRLRFDFAHFAALTDDEKRQIEEGVVGLALRNEHLRAPVMDLAEARSMGAIALFGEKYGERVRVVQIGDYSKELCGGTHLPSSAAIGGFAIVSEGSIGAGLRRIEAVTGREAQALAAGQRDLLGVAADLMKCPPDGVPERIRALQRELRSAQREVQRLQQKSAGAVVEDLATQAVDVDGVRVVAARVEAVGAGALRGLADQIRDGLGSGIVVLGCVHEGRVQFVGAVSSDLTEAGFHAGKLVGEVAKVAGGGGGGRPDFAQAGGRNPERLDEALDRVRELVASQKT